jgi:hypothetical protein
MAGHTGDDPTLHLKYEVDACLRVSPRYEVCQPFCARCGRTSGGGNYCPTCGSDLQETVSLTRCR